MDRSLPNVALLTVLLAAPLAASSATVPLYRLTDLGSFPGSLSPNGHGQSNYSEAYGINNRGQVVGESDIGGLDDEFNAEPAIHAFHWDASTGLTDLWQGAAPEPSDYITSYYDESTALSINDSGQVVGRQWIESWGLYQAFYWDAARGLTRLNTAADGFNYSSAHDINSSGLFVGERSFGYDSWDPKQAFIGRLDGPMVDIGHLSEEFDDSSARALNDYNQVVGWSRNQNGSHAFVWDNDKGMVDLGSGAAFGINNWGQVVGGDAYRAILWSQNHERLELGAGSASAINDSGHVVGNNQGAPFLWHQELGQLNLNDLLDPHDPLKGIASLAYASDINNRGQIVGTGIINGLTRGFLLTDISVPAPSVVPLPAAVWLMGSALLGLLGLSVTKEPNEHKRTPHRGQRVTGLMKRWFAGHHPERSGGRPV